MCNQHFLHHNDKLNVSDPGFFEDIFVISLTLFPKTCWLQRLAFGKRSQVQIRYLVYPYIIYMNKNVIQGVLNSLRNQLLEKKYTHEFI